jgi:predicted nucleic-acid-binding Zn-ribbon protein
MFFIMGISTSEKKIDFVQTMLCSKCGQYGRYEVYMTFTFLSLFFIPLFRWNRKFYVKSSCCQTLYAIDKEIGQRILHGEELILGESDLHIIQNEQYQHFQKTCSSCGYQADSNFSYCPKCGSKL